MPISEALESVVGPVDFDPDALKQKYLSERDKRIRPEGTGQYVQVTGDFSALTADPNAQEPLTRDVRNDTHHVAIIGGGFGGLLAAARLKEAGIDDIAIIDLARDFGGTWYWNRYPGAACDVESYIYFPLLEETGYIPKQKYAPASEIFEHAKRIAAHYDLYDTACFGASVTGATWREEERLWCVQTDYGDEIKARFVVMANGPLSVPKLPGISGIDGFQGHMFHTCRWDYAYTGQELEKLRDKRVGIIGTGATAVQCIPHLGRSAKELYVFQRTPSSIDVRDNRETDPDWAASLEPGWHRRRMENFNTLVSGGQQEEDLVSDGWTEIFRDVSVVAVKKASKKLGRRLTEAEREELMELNDYKKMNGIRQRAVDVVQDKHTAERLKPWYRQFCKRPCFHDEYLQTFNLPGVRLVDTDGRGVERVGATSVFANGQNYEIDCLIFATGFEIGTSFTRRAGYETYGHRGLRLSEHWQAGVRTHKGILTDGFPNCFFIGFNQTATTVNIPHALDEQARHLAYILSEVEARNFTRVEATEKSVEEFLAEMDNFSDLNADYFEQCTPGYYNSEGESDNRTGLYSNVYGAGPDAFFATLKAWRDEGEMRGLDLK